MRFLKRWLLRLLMIAALLAGIAYLGRDLIFQRLNEEIRARVELMIAEKHPALLVRVRSAWLVEGEGIMLRGVTASPRDEASVADPMIKVDEMFLACSTQMPQFLTEPPSVYHVEFRGLFMKAKQSADGKWNLASILPLHNDESRPPTIEILDGMVEIAGQGERPILLRHVVATVVPQFPSASREATSISNGRMPLQFRGGFTSEYCRQAEFEGVFWPDEKTWGVRGSISHFDFSRRLLSAMPVELASMIEPLASLDVQADVDFEIKSASNAGDPLRFRVAGRMLDGRIDDPRFPYALTNLRGQIDVDNDGLRLTEMTASSGATQISLSCAIHGFEENSPLTLHAMVRQLSLDHRVYTMLPDRMRDEWEKFSPSGVVNADLSLSFDRSRWNTELHVECLDLAIVYHKFPYRVDHGTGNVHLVDQRLWTDNCQVEANGQKVDVTFDFLNPGPNLTGWLEAKAHGPIPLDEQLLSALNDKEERIVRSLQPAGLVVLQRARVEKTQPDQEELTKTLELELRDCAMKYDKFPYPIYKIRGKLSCHGDEWTFRDLIGQNDSGYIVCQGSWRPKPSTGSRLLLDFDCRSVPLEDELRDALKPTARKLWIKLQPRGTIDQLRIGVEFDSETNDLALDILAQKWTSKPNAEGRSISIQPSCFPYRLEDVTGRVHVKDGVIDLQEINARHGRAILACDGQSKIDDSGNWSFDLTRLMARQLDIDRDLLHALPPQLAGSLAKLNLVGPLTASGRIGFTGHAGTGDVLTSDWDLLVDVEDGRLASGFALQNIRGGMRLFGHKDPQQFFSRGELDIHSVMYNGVQLTQVRGPLWIDESGVLFGSWTPAPAPRAIPREVTARVFGGTLAFDARVANQDDAQWVLESRLENASLSELSRDLGTRPSNVSGRVFGQLRLAGNNQGSHSWRGNGAVRLTDADIYELPQMVALLKLLVIERPDTNAFTNSDIDFRIEGDRIYFDRINFDGDAISLKGRGEMSLQRELNVHFYALVGRDDLWPAFLKPIRSETAKSLLLIQVAGTLDDPKLTRRAFPHVEETLQQLFPEAARERVTPIAPSSWQALDPRRLLPMK